LLGELSHFVRLVAVTLIAVATICLTYYVTQKVFCEILTEIPSGRSWSDILNRLKRFVEILSFAVTTFSTVGYGDVHPNGIVSRVIVMAIHCLTLSYILVLLQVLLNSGKPFPHGR